MSHDFREHSQNSPLLSVHLATNDTRASLLSFFFHPPSHIRNDRKVVLIAVDRVGEALGDASEELRGDKEVVMAAVQRDGAALRFASSALRGDKEVRSPTIAFFCLCFFFRFGLGDPLHSGFRCSSALCFALRFFPASSSCCGLLACLLLL